MTSAPLQPESLALPPDSYTPEPDIDVLDFFIVLSHGRRLVARSVVAAFVLSGLISLILPRLYEARTSLLPPQATQSSSSLMAGQISAMTGISTRELGMKNPADLYLALLASESIANDLIERFQLRELYGERYMVGARRKLASRTSMNAGKDSLITLVVEDRDPVRAANLANGYVEELQRLNSRLAITEAAQRRLFFEQQLEQVKQSLQRAELAMAETERNTGVVHVDANAKALVEQVAVLRGELAAKEVEVRAMRSFATDQNPDYRLAAQELNALRGQLASLEHGAGEGATGSMQKLSGGAVEYAGRFRELKYQETLFELLSKQYESARIDEAKEGAVIQVIDRASPPERASWPHRTLIVIASSLIMFFISTSWVLLRGTFQRAVNDPRRAVKVLQLRQLWKVF